MRPRFRLLLRRVRRGGRSGGFRRVRDKRRANRSQHETAIHALGIWAEWVMQREEYGWPRASSEWRAMELANGGYYRAPAGSRVPRIDMARRGPEVDRLLRDMDETGGFRMASVLRAGALYPREPARALSAQLGMSPRTWFRLRRHGLNRLSAALSRTARR